MTESDACNQEGILRQRCQEATKAIEDVLATTARDRHQIIDFGESAIVRLRDCLIEQYRQSENNPEERARLRYGLDQANIALSLITGVEYPGAGIQEQPMLQALKVLQALTF